MLYYVIILSVHVSLTPAINTAPCI